jgi:NTE family protein
MRHFLWAIFIFILPGLVSAQKVAVVLSGGGAKGLAHIGVLKALEEHEIPIDYIIGTSMGGIVGGMYAAGFSPEQMEQFFLLNDFQKYLSGRPSDYYNLVYKKKEDNASWITVNLGIDSTFSPYLRSNLSSDQVLNLVVEENLSALAAAANHNFDSLFVPFRTVAADIFTQNQVILDSGRLAEAVRATFTVPLFYRPIRVNKKLLFDGGLYNNFPVDIAVEEWNPDWVIGVNVANTKFDSYPYEEDEKLLSENLSLVLLDRTDPKKVGTKGTYIEPDLSPYTAFDFDKAAALIDSGYSRTLQLIDSIRLNVDRIVTCDEVTLARNDFILGSPPLNVSNIKVKGFSERQSKFLSRSFKGRASTINLADIKKGYFDLTSEKYFSKIYPKFLYDSLDGQFTFQIEGSPQSLLELEFGGNISTRSISELFIGLELSTLFGWLNIFNANFYTGRFYQSAALQNRFVFPTRSKFYVKPFFTFNEWDFFDASDILASDRDPTVIRQFDRTTGLAIGFPWRKTGKLELTAAYFNNDDNFSSNPAFISTDTLDEIHFVGGRYGLAYSRNSLNRKQYPSEGTALSLGFDFITGEEEFEPGSRSNVEAQDNDRSWFRLKFRMEQYFSRRKLKFGYELESVLSTQPLFSNYIGTLINSSGYIVE